MDATIFPGFCDEVHGTGHDACDGIVAIACGTDRLVLIVILEIDTELIDLTGQITSGMLHRIGISVGIRNILNRHSRQLHIHGRIVGDLILAVCQSRFAAVDV